MKKILLLLTLTLGLGNVQAEAPSPDTNQARPEVSEGNIPQGEVLIEGGGSMQLEEVRENGQVTRVKVVPKKGRPYYLVDSDGNGSLDQIQWILVTW
ncbi:MAG: DUF2782 domain-containing protein [Gammaproteobacteria bacterium]|nr:DUF2782 domain-containing protein [Gammaproteobacteria bacterium]